MNRLYRLLMVILVGVSVFLGFSMFTNSSSYQGTISLPQQTDLIPTDRVKYQGEDGEVELVLKAEYEIRGVVKGKRKYSDYSSQVSKYDLVLVWGDLNKEENDQNVNYSQSGRWYYYNYKQDMIEESYISKHSANVHLIPENEQIKKKINKIGKNDYIRIEGYLVDVLFPEGVWESSMTRSDTGDGACEIIYVREIDIVD